MNLTKDANTLLFANHYEYAFIDRTQFTDTVLTISISELNSVSQMLCTVLSLITYSHMRVGGGLLFFFYPFLLQFPNNFEHYSAETHITESLLYTLAILVIPERRESIE